MISLTCCCHVTLLILLLVLRQALATLNSPISSPLSSSSPQSHSAFTTTPPSSPLAALLLRQHPMRLSSQQHDNLPSVSSPNSPPSSASITPHKAIPPVFSSNHPRPTKTMTSLPSSQSLTYKTMTRPRSGQSQTTIASSASFKSNNVSSNSLVHRASTGKMNDRSATHTETRSMVTAKRKLFKENASEKQIQLLNRVEKLFLKHAGLERRPKIYKNSRVPDYMLELYRTQMENSKGPNTYLKLKGNGLIAANTVRSFQHTEPPSAHCAPPQCSRVHFDVSTIAEAELVAGAELRIFASAVDLETPSSGGPAAGSVSRRRSPPQHRLEVHEVMRPETAASEAITRLLDTRLVAANASWHSFDIQPAVVKWKRSRDRNYGIEVRLVSRQAALSTNSNIRVKRSTSVTAETWAVERPVLVVFTDDTSSPGSRYNAGSPGSRAQRTRRDAGDEKNSKNKQRKRKNKRKRRKNRRKKKKNKRRRRKKKGRKECKKHGLYVDFENVGWQDWIVAPSGYNAYYCQGDCMAPLPSHFVSSNHAMMQARVYMVDPRSVPKVCCVPVDMKPIAMLYMDENGRTVLKNYQDMVVDSCGCQ